MADDGEEFPPDEGEGDENEEEEGEFVETQGEVELHPTPSFPRPIPTLRYPEEYGEGEEYGGMKYGEYGEGGKYVLYYGEGEAESARHYVEEYEPSMSVPSVASSISEAEETEEERALRLMKDSWIEQVKQKMSERQALRRRNVFLQKKLVEHFKKRRMDHVLKEDSKGLDVETKYLKRLHAFQEFKQAQEEQIAELNQNMQNSRAKNNEVDEELKDALNKLVERQRELSTGLVLVKTGKKLSEKVVDRLLKRETSKNEELGTFRLKYIKIKNLIEDKENQLRAMESFGEGLHLMDYEQLKIDYQNFTDKIEEKDEELAKLRMKTHGNIQNLAHVREKAFAIAGDIELMEEKFYSVETRFNETREKVTKAKGKRDALREEYLNLKMQSGLLTNNRLLRDFENSIDEAEFVTKNLSLIQKAIADSKRKENELAEIAARPASSYINFKFPFETDLKPHEVSKTEVVLMDYTRSKTAQSNNDSIP